MIHIYHGDGKGKTTAACGLALRMAGHGGRVLFTQFFKDGSSGEIVALASLPTVETRHPDLHFGRYRTLTEDQRGQLRTCYRAYLADILAEAEAFDLIVLDEIVSAYNYHVIDREALLDFLRAQGPRRELVLTGRAPAPELLALADYVTEMRKQKHPFDRGIIARPGVEF